MTNFKEYFEKIQKGITPIERSKLKKGLKDLKRDYEEVYGKSTVDLELFLNQIPTIQGGGSKRRRRSKRRKSNRKRKSMRGGNNSTGGGDDDYFEGTTITLLLLFFLYYVLSSNPIVPGRRFNPH